MVLRKNTLITLFLAIATLFSLFSTGVTQAQTGDPLVDLPGTISPDLGKPSQAPPGTSQTALEQVAVTLTPRNEALFASLAKEIQDPASPRYRQAVTDAEYQQNFAPTQQAMDNLKQYFLKQGLTISYQSTDRLLLTVQGTSAQLDSAFSTKSEYRTNAAGEVGLLNVTPLKLPASLAATVKGITGFDTLHRPKINSVRAPNPAGGSEITASSPITSSNSPTTTRAAYNITNSGYTGAGTKIAITLWGGPDTTTDLPHWVSYYGHPLDLTILPNGAATATGDLLFEANMDVEMVHTAAYNASIRYYVGSTNSFTAMETAISQAVNDPVNVNAITNSWGGCESTIGSSNINSYHTIFQSAAIKNIAIFFSSGDSGVFECSGVGYAEYPAGDDLVTAVGGTTISRDSVTNAWFNEAGWSCPTTDGSNDNSCLQSGGGSSGGGKTTLVTRPAFQNTITPPAEAKFTNTAANTRLVPDISMNGNPNTGIPVFLNGCNPPASSCYLGGGTSASSPLMAGVMALAAERNQGATGGINTFIYNNFTGSNWGFDVVNGYNGVTNKVGWDYVTGLGSLKDVRAFLRAFVPCLTVSKNGDDNTCGTFRIAVDSANSNIVGHKTVDLSGLAAGTTISLTGSGVTINSGVTISRACSATGPTITISGSGVTGDGLTINGVTLNGVWVRGFNGRQIVANSGQNKLFCVKATRA